MPPKGIVPNLFGERKVYIGRDEVDMKPLEEITKDAITITEKWPDAKTINKYSSIAFNLKIQIDRRKLRKIQKLFLLKPRKTTYKTIRHDCAKRNGRI